MRVNGHCRQLARQNAGLAVDVHLNLTATATRPIISRTCCAAGRAAQQLPAHAGCACPRLSAPARRLRCATGARSCPDPEDFDVRNQRRRLCQRAHRRLDVAVRTDDGDRSIGASWPGSTPPEVSPSPSARGACWSDHRLKCASLSGLRRAGNEVGRPVRGSPRLIRPSVRHDELEQVGTHHRQSGRRGWAYFPIGCRQRARISEHQAEDTAAARARFATAGSRRWSAPTPRQEQSESRP